MTSSQTSGDRILWGEAAGFSLLLALCWSVELFRVPYLLFDEAAAFNWWRILLRTAVIAAVWICMHVTTKRLLRRLHRLEEFLLMCSWCRKIGHQDRWVTTEEYFGSKFETAVSHGICPACAVRQLEELRNSRCGEELALAEPTTTHREVPIEAR